MKILIEISANTCIEMRTSDGWYLYKDVNSPMGFTKLMGLGESELRDVLSLFKLYDYRAVLIIREARRL
jgi:hypothetical protein